MSDLPAKPAVDAERFIQQLLENIPAMVLVADRAGRVVLSNPYFSFVTGFSWKDLAGPDWLDSLFAPDDLPVMREIMAEVLAGKSASRTASGVMTNGGDRLEITWTSTGLLDAKQQVVGILFIGTREFARSAPGRSSEDGALNLAATSQPTEARDGSRPPADTESDLVHDLKNLLMGISACTDVAIDAIRQDTTARAFLDEVRRSATSAIQVIERLAALDRSDAASQES